MHKIIGEGEKLYLDRISKHIDQGVRAHVSSPQ